MKVPQSCPALCDPMNCSLPGFPVDGILQARVLEWVAITFFRGSSWPSDQSWVSRIAGRFFKPSKPSGKPKCVVWSEVRSLSHVQLFATPWTVAYQAPPSMGFSRQECWSGLPFPSPGDLLAYQAPPSMGFSRQECWSGLPFPSPGDLLDPEIEPRSPALQADTLLSEPPECIVYLYLNMHIHIFNINMLNMQYFYD